MQMQITSSKLMKDKYSDYVAGRVDGDYLWQVYERWSQKKERAYERCCRLVDEYDGGGMKIMSHNCDVFSVGFIGYIDGLKHFIYITRDHVRAMPLEKMDKETG